MHFFKKTVQKPEELKSAMSLTCIANIPEAPRKLRKQKDQRWIRMKDDRTPQAFKENIQSLQIRISRELEERGGKLLLITSTMPEEGKSTLAYNLAAAAASHGVKVLFGGRRSQKTGRPETFDRGNRKRAGLRGDWKMYIRRSGTKRGRNRD